MNGNSELKKRVLTGLIGGIALLGLVVFGGTLGIFFLSTLLSLAMIVEFTDIIFTLGDRIEKRYVLLSLGWFVALVNLLAHHSEYQSLVVTFIVLFIYFLISAKRHKQLNFSIHFKELMYSFFAVLYLIFLPLYLRKIYESANGVEWTVLFLFIVWMGDSAAYFVGKKYGKIKLYPEISPKKTREGALGGILAGILVTFVFKLLLIHNMSWLGAVFIPVFVGSMAQVGDLCESFFKRAFDKKDSGSILPGHGGMLDRFDGVIFSLPAMYACIWIFN